MFNILFIPYLSIGINPVVLCFLSIVVISFGVSVVISKNPIKSVLCLIGLFSSIACYLAYLGLDFLALSYLLVYVGAVSILFIFILMLINVRISELLTDRNISIYIGTVLGVLFIGVVDLLFGFDIELFFGTDIDWESTMGIISHIISVGNIMYANYSIWFIMISIILLLGMVGVIVITVKWKSNL